MPDSRVRSMHVLHLTADRQIDRRILQSARSLERAGWTASIVAMPRDTPGNDEANVIRIGAAVPARENLVVNVYRAARRHLGVNRGPVRWMKRLAWRHVVDPRSFYERLFWPTVAGMTADVVVANDLPMLPVATRLAESCGARLVYDSHELYCEQEFSRQERERWQAIEARFVPGCDAIITVNDSIARELEERYRLDHVHVILNAAERVPSSAPVTNLHARLGLDAGRRILLYQGGLSTGRNIDVLVRAMALVAGGDISLVLLGDGELAPILDDLIARARLGHRVHRLPAVPQDELLGVTRAAHAGVIPYQATCLNNRLCTPNKLFEFIAAGLPILASDLPELRKFVQDAEIGLVGDLATPEHTARLIDSFFADDARLATWRDNLQSVQRQVCWEKEEQKLVRLFEALR